MRRKRAPLPLFEFSLNAGYSMTNAASAVSYTSTSFPSSNNISSSDETTTQLISLAFGVTYGFWKYNLLSHYSILKPRE